MAVVSTNYVPLNSDQYEQTPEEQQAAYEEATANLQNTLLTDGIDLSGLSSMSANDLFSPNHWQDTWDSDPDHYMNSEYMRSGSGMDNAYNSGYMGHYYIGEDGNRYRKIVTYDRERDAMKEEYTDERMYRWAPSDEHKRTHRDDGTAEAAYGKEYKGSGGTGWYTEAEIKAAWDAGDMHQMQEQGVSWDQYWGYVTGVDELVNAGIIDYKTSKEDSAAILQGEKEADNWMDIPEYRALVEGLGIPLQFESRGDVYNFNGFGYSRDYWSEKSDVTGELITGIGLSVISGFVVGPLIAGALTPALGAAGAKAAAGAITKLATSYMQTGELQWEDALMSAALSYGGSQLQDALGGSGVLGEIGDKINSVGDAMGEGGGAVLNAALQAGGMSLVTQMVQNGEIDWKDAAVAAAMAGGTALLTSYLSDIGKSDAESEVLEEIKVTAQHKGTLVGEDMYQLEDGTVIYAPAEGDTSVLGNMSTLDLDGDGQLTGNDLQEIQANNYGYKDPNYQAGDSFYDKYPVPENTENPTLFTEEWANERYGTLSEEQTIQAMQRDGFTDEQIDAYLEGRYDDVGAINPNIVTHAGGWVENMEQPYTLEYRDGRHYVIMDGKLKAISEDAYTELYADLQDGGDWQSTMDKYGVTSGGNVFGGYDEHGRPIYNQSATVDDWITLDGTQPPITAPIDDFVKEPPKPPENPQDPNNTDGGNKPTGQDNNSPDTGADNQDTATGTASGGATDSTGGNGEAGSSGGASLPGGDQDSTGDAGGGGAAGGGTTGVPDFSNMTPAEVAAWWAANNGFGDSGGGSTGSGTGDNTSGNTTGSGGDGTTTGNNSGAGGDSGAGGGGNSTNTEGGGGTDSTDGGGTGGGTGSGGGEGTGTGGHTDNTGGGDSGDNTGAGTGSGGGAGAGGGTNGAEGGGSSGTSGGGTDGTSGGTGGGAGGGGEGGGGTGGAGNGLGSGNGMLLGGGRDRPEWGPLLQGYQFKAKPKPEPTVGMRMFEELWKANKL